MSSIDSSSKPSTLVSIDITLRRTWEAAQERQPNATLGPAVDAYPNPQVMQRPTILERLQVVLALALLPLAILVGVFKTRNRGRTWKRRLVDSVIHFLTSREWSIRQVLWLSGSATKDVYDKWTTRNKLPHIVDDIERGAKLLWLGNRKHDRVLLWCHGGGFVLPANEEQHLNLLKAIYDDFKDHKDGFDVALLAYALAPQSTFPIQLRQLVSAMKHLVDHGTRANHIVLGGDSAGAALILQLFAHIIHPMPDIPPWTVHSPIGGAFLMSPWVLFGQDIPSTLDNSRDIVTVSFNNFLARLAHPHISSIFQPNFDPSTAPQAWWEGLGDVVGHLLITIGEVELLKDHMVALGDRLGRKHPRVLTIVETNGVHMNLLMDFAAGEGKQSSTYKFLLTWLAKISNPIERNVVVGKVPQGTFNE